MSATPFVLPSNLMGPWLQDDTSSRMYTLPDSHEKVINDLPADVLRQVFTHVNIDSEINYEVVDWYGDGAVNHIINRVVLQEREEHSLTIHEMRNLANLIRARPALSTIGVNLGFHKRLRTKNGKVSQAMMEDVVEAVVGGVALDKGFEAAHDWFSAVIRPIIRDNIHVARARAAAQKRSVPPSLDVQDGPAKRSKHSTETLGAKFHLHRICHEFGLIPTYITIAEESSVVENVEAVQINGKIVGKARAQTRKIARALAAEEALRCKEDWLSKIAGTSMAQEIRNDSSEALTASRLEHSGGLDAVVLGDWKVSRIGREVLSRKNIDWQDKPLEEIVKSFVHHRQSSDVVFIGNQLDFNLKCYESLDKAHRTHVVSFEPWFFCIDAQSKTIDAMPANDDRLHVNSAYKNDAQVLTSGIVVVKDGSVFKDAEPGTVFDVVLAEHPGDPDAFAIKAAQRRLDGAPDWLMGRGKGNAHVLLIQKWGENWTEDCRRFLKAMIEKKSAAAASGTA